LDVVLYSKDEALVGLCREILPEIFGAQWTLKGGIPGQAPPGCDLCVWDFLPGETVLPGSVKPAALRSHWFILQRSDIGALQAELGTSNLQILLKPVTRSALRAFLAGARTRRAGAGEDSGSEMDLLRLERDTMLQFLIQANLKLQEYDQERSNFLARSAHDFRAPLTAISGYCGLLLESELGPLTPEQREVLGRVQQSATRMSRISSAMFQLSVPEDADCKSKLEGADIRECVEQALQEVALFADAKRISVTVEIEQQPETLLFEKSQIVQTLVNLLGNACKFTPRDGAIEIRGCPFFWNRRSGRPSSFEGAAERRGRESRTANSFRIDIRDSGPGIPPSQVRRIFEEYTSHGGGQTRSDGGLGLAICRLIIQRHKGRIWAESSASGAVFSFLLPLTPKEETAGGWQNAGGLARVAGTIENRNA
jgi:signal transduction histidine kinase